MAAVVKTDREDPNRRFARRVVTTMLVVLVLLVIGLAIVEQTWLVH